MPKAPFSDLLLYLRRVCSAQAARDLTDAELVELFRSHRDEAAFSVLVHRHGPMVLGICHRVLGECHGAEDAFQATFLVLVRRVASISRTGSVGSWLYAVAQRIAKKARVRETNRRRRERRLEPMRATEPLDDLTWQEVRGVLDDEIARLAEKYRAPLVLCYLQGKSYEQAARELGWPKGSLTTRLGRARELLRERLVKRGITLSGGALATVLCERVSGPAVGAMLTINTVKAAASLAAGKAVAGGCLSAEAIALAEDTVIGMLGIKAKVLVVVLALGLAVGGAGLAGYTKLADREQATKEAEAPKQAGNIDRRGVEKKDAPALTDLYGDPLPEGAIARLGTKRLRHGDIIQDLHFSADNKTLFSWDVHGVSVWDADTGRHERRFGGNQENRFLAIAVSQDCRTAVVTHTNYGRGQLEVWDAAKGKMLRSFPIGAWQRAGISPDGKTLAVRTDNSQGKSVTLELWDATTGEKLHQLAGHQDEIEDFVFSTEGNTVITTSHDKSIRFWNVATGQQVRQFNYSSPVGRVALSPDGNTLASIGVTESKHEQPGGGYSVILIPATQVVLWDLSTGKETHKLEAPGTKGGEGLANLEKGIMRIAFTPDSKTLISSDQRSIYWWEVATGKQLTEHLATTGSASGISFSPDAKTLAIANGHSVIRLWDMATGKEKLNLGGHEGAVNAVAVSPDGKTFATGGQDRVVRLWDAATGEERRQLGANEYFFQSLTFGLDGKTLISRGYEYSQQTKVGVWDTVTGRNLWRFPGSWFALAPDGKMLMTGGKEKPIHIWDMASGKELGQLETSGHGESTLVYSADGKTVFAWCSEDKMLRIWDAVTGKLLRSFPGYGFTKDFNQRALRHAFSGDGTMAAFSGNGSSRLELYDMTTGKMVQELVDASANGSVSNLAFSPDKRMLVSGDWTPGTIHVWELATGKHYHQFVGHEGRINSMTFSADGSLLLTASDDTTALVWDFTGRLTGSKKPLTVTELEGHWAALSSQDVLRAQQAVRTLVASPQQAVAFLGKQLKPVPAPDEKGIQELISKLDSGQYKTREAAMRELEQIGDVAAPEVQRAMGRKVTLELHQRLQRLLETYSTSQRLRSLRAVQLLEHCGTPEARALLESLAQGETTALLTREARAAAKRISSRSGR